MSMKSLPPSSILEANSSKKSYNFSSLGMIAMAPRYVPDVCASYSIILRPVQSPTRPAVVLTYHVSAGGRCLQHGTSCDERSRIPWPVGRDPKRRELDALAV